MTLIQADKDAVLLLGGTGYIGQRLAAKFAQRGYRVYVTYSSLSSLEAAGGFWEGAPTRKGCISAVKFSGDVSSASALMETLDGIGNLKSCINLIGNSTAGSAAIKKSNVDVTAEIATLFQTLKTRQPDCMTYHFSSIAAVKKSNRSLYAEAKDEGEKIIRATNACNYVVYHSIVDSNVEKIAGDLSKLAPIFQRSAQLMDRVELTTVGIDFLTDAIANHLEAVEPQSINTELVILEKEVILREFMDAVIAPSADMEDTPIELKDIADAVSKTGLPDSVLKRFENFIKLAAIDDDEKRSSENHYFYFGRIQNIRRSGSFVRLFKAERQEMRRLLQGDFIVPML